MVFSAKNIFLVDAVGALITALLLSQVLLRFESFFGMPGTTLWVLAALAFAFSLYSFACHLWAKAYFPVLLRIIMTANVLYCVLTSAFLFIYFQRLTGFGFAYFIGEIGIVLSLVYQENRVLSVTVEK